MKKYLLWVCFGLVGCQASFLYRPAPSEPIVMQEAVRASGVLQPQGLYFTLISHYQDKQARVIILAEPAAKLADLTVSEGQIYVHYKASQVPSRLIYAWGKLVQEQFLTGCPARQIAQAAEGIGGSFELEVIGGVCP